MITAVRPDSAKRPGSLVLHGCPADLLRKHARGFSQRKYIPLQQCPAKNILGDENPVVAGVTRTEFRLPAHLNRTRSDRIPPGKQFRSQQQRIRQRLRDGHVIPPPVRAARPLFPPPCDRLMNRLSDPGIVIQRMSRLGPDTRKLQRIAEMTRNLPQGAIVILINAFRLLRQSGNNVSDSISTAHPRVPESHRPGDREKTADTARPPPMTAARRNRNMTPPIFSALHHSIHIQHVRNPVQTVSEFALIERFGVPVSEQHIRLSGMPQHHPPLISSLLLVLECLGAEPGIAVRKFIAGVGDENGARRLFHLELSR